MLGQIIFCIVGSGLIVTGYFIIGRIPIFPFILIAFGGILILTIVIGSIFCSTPVPGKKIKKHKGGIESGHHAGDSGSHFTNIGMYGIESGGRCDYDGGTDFVGGGGDFGGSSSGGGCDSGGGGFSSSSGGCDSGGGGCSSSSGGCDSGGGGGGGCD